MNMATFEPLSRLFRGDVSRVRKALGIFERVTREDLQLLDEAYAGGDWANVARLAHKMKSGCLQIGEETAATGLASLERGLLGGQAGEGIAGEFAATRDELAGVMARVSTYLANGDGTGDE